MKFTDFKIATKIGAGFSILVALLIALGAVALSQLSMVGAGEEQLAVSNLPSVEMAGQLSAWVNTVRRLEARHVLASDTKAMESIETEIAAARNQLAGLEPEALKLFTADREAKVWNDYLVHRNAWFAEWEKLRLLSLKSNDSQAALDQATRQFNAASQDRFIETLKDVQELSDINKREAEGVWEAGQKEISQARLLVISAMGISVVLAIILAVLISRAIARPISEAVQVAATIAKGDMTAAIQADGKDETSQLLQALAAMRDGLVHVVSSVRQSSESVATASAEIAQGNQDLSSRTEQQASALQETAASMEQLGSTVRQNADSARQADQLAKSASSVAAKGGAVVGQVVETMKNINESSKRIADIISVIDGIAFQTNILALNAAVEAARAGEQGRGFAVVASEVRSLAARSADAAKEIKSLIHASVERVEQGTDLADQAGLTMTEVVSAIQRVTDLMGEISAASSEQAAGVSQIGEAVQQMDQATQQNAALVEEMAAAASSLKGQASDLVQSVGVFQLGTQAGEAAQTVRQEKVAVRAADAAAQLARTATHKLGQTAAKAMAIPQPFAMRAPKLAAAGIDDNWTSF